MQRANSAGNGFEHTPTPKKHERKVMPSGLRPTKRNIITTDTSPLSATGGRKYLPTLSDLVDRLTIVQQKMIFIPEKADEYRHERELILYDIDVMLKESTPLNAQSVLAICLIQLTNRFVWENEAHVRNGDAKSDMETLHRLRLTHSINGVRNSAKNMLANEVGGRHDYKIDCMASDLPKEFGNWDIFR